MLDIVVRFDVTRA